MYSFANTLFFKYKHSANSCNNKALWGLARPLSDAYVVNGNVSKVPVANDTGYMDLKVMYKINDVLSYSIDQVLQFELII